MTAAILEFFREGKLLKAWNTTFLTLIRKTQSVRELKDYRPISLCNVFYKRITKIMAERMKQFLPILISPKQDGFVQDRQITDGVVLLLMHELLHSI